MAPTTRELVEAGDLEELVRQVDRLAAARDWDGLVELRDRARGALERGFQLWPAASLAEYRLALEAPGSLAASVVVEGAGHFALGPLPEVVASTHAWSELRDHLAPGPLAAITAFERVLRGEGLEAEPDVDRGVFELPLALQPWEPAYPLATYKADAADFPRPALPTPEPTAIPADAPPPREGPAARHEREALGALVRTWTTQSEGTAVTVAVEGDLTDALAALGKPDRPTPARAVAISPADALALMAWAGASGGRHGRRRGMAAGRFDAWWAAAVLTGIDDRWPVDPDELGAAASELRWWIWDEGRPETGWVLRLAVEDPLDGLAWAMAARDTGQGRAAAGANSPSGS